MTVKADSPVMAVSSTISRRSFLKKTGWVAAGLTVTAAVAYPFARAAMPIIPTTGIPVLEDGFAWVQAMPDGRIRFLCPRMEMGQGTQVGLSQIVAEELNLDPSQIECVLPDTDQTPPFQLTVGSRGIEMFFDPVSQGAAQLREKLRGYAAEKTGLMPDQIRDGGGGFVLPDKTSLSYAALTPLEPVVLSAGGKSPPRYAVERQGRYRTIGKPWRHHDLEAIVTGKAVYSRDAIVPGMLFGLTIRPPAFGTRMRNVDSSAANVIPGVTTIVVDQQNGFVGVVADNPFALPAAIAAIGIDWEVSADLNQSDIDSSLDVDKLRAAGDLEHILANEGNLSVGRGTAVHQINARYETSFAAHAAMEPRAAVAWVKKDKVEIWCGSQDPFFVQRRVAKIIGRDVGDVVVHSHRIGGGFGGRVLCQPSEEAALLSAAVGKPVRVQWDRDMEFQNNSFQPAYSHRIDAGVTQEGTISHWEHDFVSSPILTGPVPGNIAWVLDMVVGDEGTARGGLSHYRMANRRVRYSDIRTPVPISAWRGLGAAPNTFAIESMMDELAVSAALDPLAFRLKNLPATGYKTAKDVKLAKVLRRVGEIADWGRTAPQDVGRGIAGAVYRDQTAVAIVAEVHVDHTAGELRVTKIWCVQDCGLVINPDQVENQIMGNIAWGCSMALKERITFEAGAVEQSNFDNYDILRHNEMPEILVELSTPSEEPPVAVGESAFAPVAPAIANAVFAATKRRVRRLPMLYDDVFSTRDSRQGA